MNPRLVSPREGDASRAPRTQKPLHSRTGYQMPRSWIDDYNDPRCLLCDAKKGRCTCVVQREEEAA